jgi:hypothetical protein
MTFEGFADGGSGRHDQDEAQKYRLAFDTLSAVSITNVNGRIGPTCTT